MTEPAPGTASHMEGPARWERIADLVMDATDNELIQIARLTRREMSARIHLAEAEGDGPRVDALTACAREMYTFSVFW